MRLFSSESNVNGEGGSEAGARFAGGKSVRRKESRSSTWAALSLGVRVLLERPKLALLFGLLSIAQGAMQGLLIWTLREVLVQYSEASSIGAGLVVWTAAAVFGVWVLRAGTRFAARVTTVYLSRRIEIESMWEVLLHLMKLPYRFFEESSDGDLIVSSYQDLKGIRMTAEQVGSILLNLATLLGLLSAAWIMSPKLTLIGLVAVPAGLTPAYWLARRVAAASDRQRETTGSLYSSFMQVIAGIQTIKVNRASGYVMERAEDIGKRLVRHNVAREREKQLTSFLFETISGVGMVAVLVVGGTDVAGGAMRWENMVALIMAVAAVYAPIKSLLSSYTGLHDVAPNLERVERIMNTEAQEKPEGEAAPVTSAPDTIELRDVTFGYESDDPVLHEVSATFYRGETIGIVGPSGAGKSTLVALLLRYYDADAGQILFDGHDIEELDYGGFMDQAAVVLQEPFLFTDTVARNISLARPEATREQVIEAARSANVHAEIEAMERGYETVVGRGEDKRGVSVGQKQRITIAAALLKNAPLLFLDEATSNLDAVSERKVQEAIDRLMEGRTTFVIAHRLSTLRAADRILVMNEGRVVGLDPHEKLLSDNEMYETLWKHQMEDARQGDTFDSGGSAPEVANGEVAERGASVEA